MDFEEYQPFPTQLQAHLDPSPFKLFGGIMNCGKSFWLCAEAIRLSLMFPGNQGILGRFRGKDLRKTTIPILEDMIPRKLLLERNKTEGTFLIKTPGKPSRIYCSDFEDPNKFKSFNAGWFGIEEATDVPDDRAFNMLTTRLRLDLPGIRRFGLLTSNPEPGWVKDKFISENKKGFTYFKPNWRENPAHTENYREQLKEILPPHLYMRYLEGSWEAFDNQIFKSEWIKPGQPDTDMSCKITFVDPAVSEKKEADETAIVTIGIEYQTGTIFDLEVVHGRWSYEDIKKNCHAAYARQKPEFFYVESVQAQDWLVQDLRKENLAALPFKPDTDKIRKAYSIQHFFQQEKIKISNSELQKQLLEFPNGTHDDLADALISALVCLKQTSSDITKNPSWWEVKERKKLWGDGSQDLDMFETYRRLMG